jgi:hypothetical protein
VLELAGGSLRLSYVDEDGLAIFAGSIGSCTFHIGGPVFKDIQAQR